MQDLDRQAMLINALNFDLNARIDLLVDLVTVLAGGGGDVPLYLRSHHSCNFLLALPTRLSSDLKLRPNIVGPCVFCLVLGALYFLGSTGSTAMADKSSKGGLPAALDRIETMEVAMG